MLSALILASTLSQTPKMLVLYKSVPLVGQSVRYWDVTDTALDSAQSETSFGGEYAMTGGTGRVILIKFGDLDRAVGSTRKVKHARLIFSYAGGDKPALNSISQVLVPWGEGPIVTLNSLRFVAPQLDSSGKPVAIKAPPAPRWSATWKQRRAGEIAWQEAGASGPGDVREIKGAKLEVINDHEFAIDGLDTTIQSMIDRWFDNHGFALKLDTQTEIASSQSSEGRPRLELELESEKQKILPDLSVVRIERSPDRPSDGQEVTYTAHVKNVGTVPSEGFSGIWFVHERSGSATEVNKTVMPGHAVTMTYSLTAKTNKSDHISDPIGLRITPRGTDASASNDYCEIQQDAPTLNFYISADAAASSSGNKAMEDRVQDQIRVLNDTEFAQSRFSFAPLGVLERVNVGAVTVGDGAVAGELNASIKPDSVEVTGPPEYAPLCDAIKASLMKRMGLVVRPYTTKVALAQAVQLDGSGESRYPGIMGWGDTQCDAALASALNLSYQAVFNPIFEGIRPERTDLFSATTVALINRTLGGNFKPELLTDLPKTVIIRAVDYNGGELKDTELSFFQSVNGMVPDAPPVFTATTATGGTVLISSRDAAGGQANPYGPLSDLRTTFLVKASGNGCTEWAWLPAWELFDSASRGNKAAAVFELYFNLPSAPIDMDSNLAKNRIVTDSGNKLPAQLVPLVDGDLQTEVTLGSKAGDWVEIDLGRDRPIAEVRISFKGSDSWKRFDLITYATGQRVTDAFIWSREMDLDWSLANRSADEGNGVRSIAYRGAAQRFRFLRIINGVEGTAGKIAEVKVFAAKLPTP